LLCPTPETVWHIFVECAHSVAIWEKAEALIAKVFLESNRVVTSRAIIIGYADIKMPKEVLQAVEDIRFVLDLKLPIYSATNPFLNTSKMDRVALSYFQPGLTWLTKWGLSLCPAIPHNREKDSP